MERNIAIIHFNMPELTEAAILSLRKHGDGVAKSPTQLSDFTFTFHFHALEREMATLPVHQQLLALIQTHVH